MDENQSPEERFLAGIEKFGRFITHIAEGEAADEPAFSYSTGFASSLSHPEFILFSLSYDLSHWMLNSLYERIQNGEAFEQGQPVHGCLEGFPVYFFKIRDDAKSAHLTWTEGYLGGPHFEAWQVVWPTSSGIFPWQKGWTERLDMDQPNLTPKSWAELQKQYDLPL